MSYSSWQIHQMRTALENYRNSNGQGGNALPIKTLLMRILRCKAVTVRPSVAEADENLKEESLRRFIVGIGKLQDHKLDNLVEFLCFEEFLVKEDFDREPGDLTGFLGIHRYLANEDDRSKEILSRLPNQYCSDVGMISLNFLMDVSKTFLRVEETQSFTALLGGADKDGGIASRVRRRGYGFLSLDSYCLFIFLFSAAGQMRVYTQMFTVDSWRKFDNIVLLRVGEGNILVYPSEHRRFEADNIFSFKVEI